MRRKKAAVTTRGQSTTMNDSVPPFPEYHAHVYYTAETRKTARSLCERAADEFGIVMGRMHDQPVGPHPMASCQLAFGAAKFGDVIPWLMRHRDGLTIFVHGESGDMIADHTLHVMWLGNALPLNLDGLK